MIGTINHIDGVTVLFEEVVGESMFLIVILLIVGIGLSIHFFYTIDKMKQKGINISM